ncbi:MAG TPA: hypothetical protein VEH84_17995 [Alphaproteobacteria bacterium]|nr:hypothetical protein [Alphaproteobacteria bacterium]
MAVGSVGASPVLQAQQANAKQIIQLATKAASQQAAAQTVLPVLQSTENSYRGAVLNLLA